MYRWSNCDRKSQLSEILTEPLNPSGSGCLERKQILSKDFQVLNIFYH